MPRSVARQVGRVRVVHARGGDVVELLPGPWGGAAGMAQRSGGLVCAAAVAPRRPLGDLHRVQLPHVLDAFELVSSAISERVAGSGDQIPDGSGAQDLVRFSVGHYPRGY